MQVPEIDLSIGKPQQKNKRHKRNASSNIGISDHSLPKLDTDRYSTSLQEGQGPLLNFVTASKRQMVRAYEMTSPQAQRFFVNNLMPNMAEEKQNLSTLSHKRLSKQRPSVQSTQMRTQKDMITQENQEMLSTVEASYRMKSTLMHEADILLNPMRTQNVMNHKPSMASLGQSSAQYTVQNQMTRSPSSTSVFQRDYRQLQQWLDGKEIQLFQQLEEKVEPDEIQKLNKDLQQVYFAASSQIMTKSPLKGGQLDQLLLRTIQGMQSCFQKQQEVASMIVENYQKEKNVAILEMERFQKKYEDYVKHESVEAYLDKVQYLVDRKDSSTTVKQKHRLLIKNVDEFLKHTLLDEEVMNQKNNIPNFEPSGAESALLQLQIISKNVEPPSLTARPEAEEAFEKQKTEIFKGMMHTLHGEAEQQRRMMENHIRSTLIFKIPTADVGTGTITYDTMHTSILDDYIEGQNRKAKEKQEKIDNKWKEALQKQMQQLEIQLSIKSNIIKEQRNQLIRLDTSAQIELINQIINDFFRSVLGPKFVDKIPELQNLIEDITLTEEDREAKQKQRAQKKLDLENEKKVLEEKERLEKKNEKLKLKEKAEMKQQKNQLKKNSKLQKLLLEDKKDQEEPDLKEDSEKELFEEIEDEEGKNSQTVEGQNIEVVVDNREVIGSLESLQSLERLQTNQIIVEVYDNSSDNPFESPEKEIKPQSVHQDVISEKPESSASSERPVQKPNSVVKQPLANKSSQQKLKIKADTTLSVTSGTQGNNKIVGNNRSSQSIGNNTTPRNNPQKKMTTQNNTSENNTPKNNSDQNNTPKNNSPPKNTTKNNVSPQKSFEVTQQIQAEKAEIEEDQNLKMIVQIKQIKEISDIFANYEERKTIQKDFDHLEELFDNLKIAKAQIDMLALIFGNHVEINPHLAEMSKQLLEQANSLKDSIQIAQAIQVKEKLRQLIDVEAIVLRAEQFIKSYESASNEEITEMYNEVKRAFKINFASNNSLLPSPQSKASIIYLNSSIQSLLEKVDELISSKIIVPVAVNTGVSLEKAIASVSSARQQMSDSLLKDSKLEKDALHERAIKLIQKMDEAVQWMQQIKEHGLQHVTKMEEQRLAEKHKKRLEEEKAREKFMQLEIDKMIQKVKSNHDSQSQYTQKVLNQSPIRISSQIDDYEGNLKFQSRKGALKSEMVIGDESQNQNNNLNNTFHKSNKKHSPTNQHQSSNKEITSRKSQLPININKIKSDQDQSTVNSILSKKKSSSPQGSAGLNIQEMSEHDSIRMSDERKTGARNQTPKSELDDENTVERHQVYRKTPTEIVDMRNHLHQENKQIRHVQKNQDNSTYHKNVFDAEDSAESPEIKMEYQYTVKNLIASKQNSVERLKGKDKVDAAQQRKVVDEPWKNKKNSKTPNETGGFNTTGEAESQIKSPRLQSKIAGEPAVYINNKLVPKEKAGQPRNSGQKKDKNIKIGKNTKHNQFDPDILRSSIPETDYRKTGSEFAPHSPQRNLGIRMHDTQQHPQLRNDVYVHAHLKTITNNPNFTSPTLKLNEDLEMETNTKSVGSDSMEGNHQEYQNNENVFAQDTVNHYRRRNVLETPQIIRVSPKVTNWKEDEYTLKMTQKGHVLMIPQQTQTENRSFIKYLLNLINEAMTHQLDMQMMSKDQYLSTIEKFNQVIPEVYNNVKSSADSFFLKDHQIPHIPIYEQQNQVMSKHQLQVTNSRPNLIKSPSFASNLHFQSQKELGENLSKARSKPSLSPSQSPQRNNGSPKKAIQFLQLSDFSRYGMHTLDIKKEIQERVTIKQVGMIGGGFAAHRGR